MQYNFDFNGLLMPRRISYPIPDTLSIQAGIVNVAKAGLYSSILKQIEIYKRMDDDGMATEWPVSMFGTPVFSDVTITSIKFINQFFFYLIRGKRIYLILLL